MYYAGPGNRFWTILSETGLTPRLLSPEMAGELLHVGIGLTDLAKDASGADSEIPRSALAPARLVELLETWRPAIVAFNGKYAARTALGRPVDYGEQTGLSLGGATPWVLPSTSGAARRYWSVEPWRGLAATVRSFRAARRS